MIGTSPADEERLSVKTEVSEFTRTALANTAEYALAAESLEQTAEISVPFNKSAKKFLTDIYGEDLDELELDQSHVDSILAHLEALRHKPLNELQRERARLFLQGKTYKEIWQQLQDVTSTAVQVSISNLKTNVIRHPDFDREEALVGLREALAEQVVTLVAPVVHIVEQEPIVVEQVPVEVLPIKKIIPPVEVLQEIGELEVAAILAGKLKLTDEQSKVLMHFLDTSPNGMKKVIAPAQEIIDTLRTQIKKQFGSLGDERLGFDQTQISQLRKILGWYYNQGTETIYPAQSSYMVVRNSSNVVDYRKEEATQDALSRLTDVLKASI